MTTIPFPIRSQPGPSPFMGEPRLINTYPEEIGPENRAPIAFLSIPGQAAFVQGLGSICRGLMWSSGLSHVYAIAGQTVYKVDAAGAAFALPGILPGVGTVVWDVGPERYRQGEVTISISLLAVVTWLDHRLKPGDKVQFTSSGELPSPMQPGTDYYVLAAGLTADTFQISETEGGPALNTAGVSSGTITAILNRPTRQIVVVSGPGAYCIEDDHILRITMPEDETVNSVTYLAGRYVFSMVSGRNYYSEINDALTVDPLSYFTAESRPDGMVRALAHGGQLYLFGQESTEVYAPTEDADAPFTRLGGTFINKGSLSRDSIVSFDNAPHFVGHDGIVYRAQDYSAVRVSTHSVERAIEKVSDWSTIRAYTDAEAGHLFYVLTCEAWTWVYDAATGVWHERKSHDRPDWRAWPAITAFGKRIVGDKSSATLRLLDRDAYDEDGRPVRCDLILPDVPGKLVHHRLEVDVQTGTGLNVVPEANFHEPQMMLRWSDDGGHTWSNERAQSVGAKGEYGATVKFGRLGAARTMRGRRYKLSFSDPVARSFLLGDLIAEPLA